MRTAFYAPMKSPDHPTPSGDRGMARAFFRLLEDTGHRPFLASDFRSYEGAGDAARQNILIAQAEAEIRHVLDLADETTPDLWFTYHCYYKAPDLVGPAISRTLGIPYVIAEPSRARKRLGGQWDAFAQRAETAVDTADLLLAMTEHDRFALDRDAPAGQQVVSFPPFLDVGPEPAPPAQSDVLRLLAVAMMRSGDKLDSYRTLAQALSLVDGEWRLTVVGDGPERAEVETLFDRFGGQVRFLGRIDDRAAMRNVYETHDVLVWPGVGEAYGMVYLEAQAAGTPVICEDRSGPRAVVGDASARTPPGNASAFCEALKRTARDPAARTRARGYVVENHAWGIAEGRLNAALEALKC